MDITVSTRAASRHRTIAFALLVATLLPPLAVAELEVGISVGLSHTDNVFLTAAPTEIDDIVYGVSPTINFLHETPRFDANLRYRYNWYRYQDVDVTSSYHMGEASITGKWWQDSLAIELGARRGQVLRDPTGTVPPSRLPITDNLVDRNDVYLYPRLERALGRVVMLSASHRYSEGGYEDPTIQDDTNQDTKVSIDNFAAGQGLSWALRYRRQKTQYEISRDWEYQQAAAELGYWIDSRTRLFGLGGMESPWDDPFNPDLEDEFWEAGFAHTRGENLSAEFAIGERTYGKAWRGLLDYSFRRGSTTLSYAETPTTTALTRSGERRSVLDPDDLDEFLDAPGSAERYLSKRLQWDLSLEFRRSTVSVALFDEDRLRRIQADGTPLPDQSQRGIRVYLSWQAGVRTEFNAGGAIIRRDEGPGSRSDLRQAGVGLTYRLGTRTSLALTYSYDEQQPNDVSSEGLDYVANVVSLLLTYTR